MDSYQIWLGLWIPNQNIMKYPDRKIKHLHLLGKL